MRLISTLYILHIPIKHSLLVLNSIVYILRSVHATTTYTADRFKLTDSFIVHEREF